MGEMRNAYSILVAKADGKGTLRRPSPRCKDNTVMYLKENVV
jgi:phage FluMu protein Com